VRLRAVLRPRAAAAPAVQQLIDISYLPGSKPAACCCSGRMGQTHGRTPYRYVDPAPHTMQYQQSNRTLKLSDFPPGCIVTARTPVSQKFVFESVYKNIKPLDKNDILVCSRKTILWTFLKIKTLLFFTLF